MSEKTSDQVSIPLDEIVTTTAQLSYCDTSAVVQSTITSPQRRILQNYLLIWLDVNIVETNDFYQNAITQLRTIVSDVSIFTDLDQCTDYLTDIFQEKVFIIISEAISKQMIPRIYDMDQLDTIYILSDSESQQEQLFTEYPKVKSKYTEIASICEAIRQAVKRCDQNFIPISFIPAGDETSNANLDQLHSSFMYTQIFKEILLDTEYNQQSIKDLVLYWRSQYVGNSEQLNNIDEFGSSYRSDLSISWYTRHWFTYSMLNRALRTLEADIIIKIGFFICDLHRQLVELHAQQFNSDNTTLFTVYRGQGLSKADFEKLVKTKGGLISFNSFLSTSKNRQVCDAFADVTNSDMVGIIFKMTIDPSIPSTPFALISGVSYYKEEDEVLFSMHSVFRIGEIEKIENNDQLYQVELKLTGDDDQQLRALTDRIREETYPAQKGWYRMGTLLIKLGQFQQAEEICKTVQEELFDDTEKMHFYNICGEIKSGLGDYKKAVFFYEKVVELSGKVVSPNDPNLAAPYNNLGTAYHNIGDHSKALLAFEKALEISQKALPENDSRLANYYNNMGSMLSSMGEYLRALSFHQQALEIQQKALPPYHPDLISSFRNIASVHNSLGDYSKAQTFLNEAHKICEKVLTTNHPELVVSFNNMASVYADIGEYSKACSLSEQALKIAQETLLPTHPDLATFYCNIGKAYEKMGEYSKILLFYEKALKIRQQALPVNHPSFVQSYHTMGSAYYHMGDFSKALAYHKKALEINRIALPPTHSHLATSFNQIGLIYHEMEQYLEALSFYQQALEIMKKCASSHPDLACCYSNIASIHKELKQYSKALSFYKEAIHIVKTCLKRDHPDLADLYDNIGVMYHDMKEYKKALRFCKKSLRLRQQTLPETHPTLVNSYNNISQIYLQMEEYSTALSYAKRAFQIVQKSLSSNHPNFQATQDNLIGIIGIIGIIRMITGITFDK